MLNIQHYNLEEKIDAYPFLAHNIMIYKCNSFDEVWYVRYPRCPHMGHYKSDA